MRTPSTHQFWFHEGRQIPASRHTLERDRSNDWASLIRAHSSLPGAGAYSCRNVIRAAFFLVRTDYFVLRDSERDYPTPDRVGSAGSMAVIFRFRS